MPEQTPDQPLDPQPAEAQPEAQPSAEPSSAPTGDAAFGAGEHPSEDPDVRDAQPETEAETESAANRPSRRILSPWEGIERLDRQWEDQGPLRGRSGVSLLILTVPEDPRGFDYLGAMGLSDQEAADACQAWLEAQLAADATELGRLARPTVALVPAGRLWYVVRTVLGSLILMDGPGYLSPVAAVIAARRRYRALLLAQAESKASLGATSGEDDAESAPASAIDPDAADDQGEPAPADEGGEDPAG